MVIRNLRGFGAGADKPTSLLPRVICS